MGTLLLVRHAQASFLSDNYDRLSALGIDQARQLGRYWSARGEGFDAVVVGPRRRHAHTAEVVLEALGGPAPSTLEELDEYPAEEVLTSRLSSLLEARPDLVPLSLELAGPDHQRRGRAVDLLLREALRDWILREATSEAHLSWQSFRQRVAGALGAITQSEGRGRRVLVVSSAGTIGALAAEVLAAPPETALELGFMLNNAAVTEIVYSPGKRSLARFNVLSHLPEATDWTRR